jgi:hypothetical protein
VAPNEKLFSQKRQIGLGVFLQLRSGLLPARLSGLRLIGFCLRQVDNCFADLACKKIVICETPHIPHHANRIISIDIHFLPKANHAKSSVDFRVRICGIARGAIDCVFCAGSYDWECHRHQEQS